MPQLRQERSGSDGACPDASTILAVIEGEADEWLRNAYAQHLAHCSACLELDSRLRNFDRPVLADETEWKRTEKRLDHWLGAFVESRATAAPPAMEKRAARAGFWKSIWRPGLAWKLSLAMGLVALVAVGASVYTKWRLPFWPDQAKVSTRSAPPEEPSSMPLPAENPHPKSEVPKSTERETPGLTAPLPAGGVMYRGGPMAAAPKVPPQVKAQPKTEESARVEKKANPSSPQEQTTTAQETRKASRPSEPGPEPQLQASVTPHSNRAAATTSDSHRPGVLAARTVARPASAVRVAPSLPVSLHLGAGVRLWIMLASVNRHADGSFSFRGSLLLPLTTAGSSSLDRGTEVSGSGTIAQNRTSLLISEIVIQGSRYKLKAGTVNAQTAGSGGVVPFDSGRVFEMWLSSDSTYERAAAAESPRQ